jgi:hypothetical protein
MSFLLCGNYLENHETIVEEGCILSIRYRLMNLKVSSLTFSYIAVILLLVIIFY